MKKINSLIANYEYPIAFFIIVFITITTANIIGKYLQKKIKQKAEEQNTDITVFLFIRHAITAIIYLFGFGWALLSLPISETFAHSLFAGAGVSTLILGFASQQILGNAISGIYLIFKKPFKINDFIEIQGNKGRVIELNLHETIIEDETKNIIIIPNSLISNGIIKNLSQNNK